MRALRLYLIAGLVGMLASAAAFVAELVHELVGHHYESIGLACLLGLIFAFSFYAWAETRAELRECQRAAKARRPVVYQSTFKIIGPTPSPELAVAQPVRRAVARDGRGVGR